MKDIIVCKADGIGENTIEDMVIYINRPLPLFPAKPGEPLQAWMGEIRSFYESQAGEIADALINSLPQGTRHQLLIELLKREPNLQRGR